MSSERAVPAPRHRPSRVAGEGLCVVIIISLALAGCSRNKDYVVLQKAAPDASRVAQVRLAACGEEEWCHSLWVGTTQDTLTPLATLRPAVEQCDEIAWARDGARVAFLINGYQLRLYDTRTNAPVGQLDLVPADRQPTTRIARGVTFSDTGAAITFDDCPRDRSGCRPGIVALR